MCACVRACVCCESGVGKHDMCWCITYEYACICMYMHACERVTSIFVRLRGVFLGVIVSAGLCVQDTQMFLTTCVLVHNVFIDYVMMYVYISIFCF